MGAPGGRGGFGWAILVAALAVPGFFSYRWWSSVQAERSRGLSAKARTRLPTGVFLTPLSNSDRLVNPIAPSTAAPVAAVRPAPAAPAAHPSPAVSDPPAAAAAPAGVSASTAATVVLPRDPMLSPLDVVRLREAEMEAERARREIEEAARRRAHPERRVRREPPIEDSVELQGIVGKADGGSLAIVNGETVNPGESFAVEGFSAKVRVLRISAVSVTFEYKKRRFTKRVNAAE